MQYEFLRFPGGKAKAVTLSYDDGSVHDVRLFETIQRYDLKCTFNLVGGAVAQESGLSKAFIRDNILACGHEIANHGYFHRALDVIRPIEGIRDLLDNRLYLENEFGILVRGMAFADHGINRFKVPDAYERIKPYLRDLDVTYARTIGGDNDRFALPEDFHQWMATAHHDNPEIFAYIEKFVNMNVANLYCASRSPKLFYLWGHSHEFESRHNWEHLDDICARLSGKEDVWYATNGEIYEYVHAYRSLVYSADGKRLYNPTLFDIWLDTDGVLSCVKSGETLVR